MYCAGTVLIVNEVGVMTEQSLIVIGNGMVFHHFRRQLGEWGVTSAPT